ncbi:MAG: xanthine dehydrogenase accessory protein XdhC [Pseudomonadota bacterium]
MTEAELLAGKAPLIEIRLETVEGSAPREAGAAMLVSAEAEAGTIGGGRLEYEATIRARAMLVEGADKLEMTVPLGPALGQCCGGRVRLSLRRLDGAARSARAAAQHAEAARRPAVLIFGAGHTGMALAGALAPLPLTTSLIDERRRLLDGAPEGVRCIATPLPEATVRAAPPGSAFVVLTHDHATDFLIAGEALSRGDAAYVGMIGSATKRARFLSQQAPSAPIRHEDGRQGPGLDPGPPVPGGGPVPLTCPIGAAGLGDKRPAVIALHTASEIMQVFARAAARPAASTTTARLTG